MYNKQMKYLYKFRGKVRRGKDRGKRLGFPTANTNLWQKIPEGVYISKTRFSNKIYPSLTFIGRAKTFNENLYQAETYIFSFNQSLYKQFISVKLIKKIRGSMAFSSEKALQKQIGEDIKKTKEFFTN